MALGDVVMMRDGGVVTGPSAELYARAWQLDRTQLRAGLLSALPAYADGDVEAAEAHWDKVRQEMTPDDAQLLGMLEAFKTRIDEEREAGTEATE